MEQVNVFKYDDKFFETEEEVKLYKWSKFLKKRNFDVMHSYSTTVCGVDRETIRELLENPELFIDKYNEIFT